MSFAISDFKYMIQPGYMYITETATSIYGITGSGVFVGLFDERNQYSGVCSYLYPNPPNEKTVSTKYGSTAIKHLIKKMKNKGSNIADLKAHLIGGSDTDTSGDYGQKNVNIAKTVLSYFTIEVISSDTGGRIGRKFIYDTESGQTLTYKTEKIRKSDWFPYEKRETN